MVEKPTQKMERLKKLAAGKEWASKASSSILRNAELEYALLQNKNTALEKHNEALKKKIAFVTANSEQTVIYSAIGDVDHPRNQLVRCQNQLLASEKKIRIQEKELKRERQQSEVLRREVESAKKALQAAKQQAVGQRAEERSLKEKMGQAVRERDGCNDKWLRCRSECAELRDKIAIQQSNLHKKDGQCKEQARQIHLLQVEKQKLQREAGFLEIEAGDQKREYQKREEELHEQNLKESIIRRDVERRTGKRINILEPKPRGKFNREAHFRKVESLQRELLSQTEELRRTLKLCEELKRKLAQVSLRALQSQATVRDQKEKLEAATAMRNMYKNEMEKMQKALDAVKKEKICEKLKKWAVKKKKKKIKEPSLYGVESSHVTPHRQNLIY